MSVLRLRFWMGAILLLVSMGVVIRVNWKQKQVQIVNEIDLANIEAAEGLGSEQYSANRFRVELSRPVQVFLGDYGELKLTIQPTNPGAIEPIKTQAVLVSDEPVHPASIDTQNNQLSLLVDIDIRGFDLSPGTEMIKPFVTGQRQTFTWKIRPRQSGNYPATVWVYLVNRTDQPQTERRIPVTATRMEILVVSFLGLDRLTMTLISIFGAGFGLFATVEPALLGLSRKNENRVSGINLEEKS